MVKQSHVFDDDLAVDELQAVKIVGDRSVILEFSADSVVNSSLYDRAVMKKRFEQFFCDAVVGKSLI